MNPGSPSTNVYSRKTGLIFLCSTVLRDWKCTLTGKCKYIFADWGVSKMSIYVCGLSVALVIVMHNELLSISVFVIVLRSHHPHPPECNDYVK